MIYNYLVSEYNNNNNEYEIKKEIIENNYETSDVNNDEYLYEKLCIIMIPHVQYKKKPLIAYGC